jgi:hypothetical protein
VEGAEGGASRSLIVLCPGSHCDKFVLNWYSIFNLEVVNDIHEWQSHVPCPMRRASSFLEVYFNRVKVVREMNDSASSFKTHVIIPPSIEIE